MSWRALLVAAALVVIAACAEREPAPSVAVERGWMRAPVPGATMTAAYFDIVNRGDTAIVIDGVSSPQFGNATLHSTRMIEGRMTMRPMAALTVEPGGRATLAPGADHVMLGDARVPLDALESIELTLTSAGAPMLSVTLPVARTSPWEDSP